MPQPSAIQSRLSNVEICLTMTANTLQILADTLKIPFMGAIMHTTQAISKTAEEADQLIGGTRTLHKIHNFVEAQQDSNRVKNFFRLGEIGTLRKECEAGLQQAFGFFEIELTIQTNAVDMQEEAYKRHREISGPYSGSHCSSNSISMLPSEPKIFHGRASELSDILDLFNTGTPRIAILGAGGMGKTSLARALLHHPKITATYEQNRFFVACNSATTVVELVALIGAHLGLNPGKNLTQPVLRYLASSPPMLLILDELEILWEPTASRGDLEGVDHLALIITMRGAERPGKVHWTHPFLPLLKPVDEVAAHLIFMDISDSGHDLGEVNKILALTDNMPLAISLLAHLADSEGCSNVLSRWQKEKTSVISDGFDKRSNLDLSISLSLSSPRIHSLPQSQELLSLLSMLPDGLLDMDLIRSKLPLADILRCKTALKATALAYSDENNRLKVLMPVRELSNFSNIQNVVQWGLDPRHAEFLDNIYCACYLNRWTRVNSQPHTHLIRQIHDILPQMNDHRLHVYVITEILASWHYYKISDPDTLISQGMEHSEHLDDTDLKCSFYLTTADYYSEFEDHIRAVNIFPVVKTQCPNYMLMKVEGWPGYLESYTQKHRQPVLKLYAGLTSAVTNNHYPCVPQREIFLFFAAEIYKYKSEYGGARDIYTLIIQNFTADQNPYWHAVALVNRADIEVSMAVPKDDVQRNIDRARLGFIAVGLKPWITICDGILAALYLRERNLREAKLLLEKCLKSDLDSEIKSFCLGQLGNVCEWGSVYSVSMWTTIFLAHSLKYKMNIQVHKALQFFGDMFLDRNDKDTAISLFTLALEGFTYMDVHRGRAECMLRLGDISHGCGDPIKAMEFWEAARPLFECSSQVQQVENIDDRLANMRRETQVQHKMNSAKLAERNVPLLTMDQAAIEDFKNISEDENIVADAVAH
ncbi:hypothetical protein DFH08DRAFT_816254 [Mycena albidolilacea]|uniref:Uncharacterized protein n=1 Tax=Mycena albidolilacea TaxID=1033008 RepID=A0AAD7EK13_9AGAR|nr:hypothetical protein DFH08DRAFT_816254 [Mycena albidolilacea]